MANRGSSAAPGTRSANSTPSARASATVPTGSSTGKSTKKPKPAPSHLQYAEAEELVPDIDAALQFLRERRLVPEGEGSLTEEALVTGLLHFACDTSSALTRTGLVAFSRLAKTILTNRMEHRVVAAVAERTEAQIVPRLDSQASTMEKQLDAHLGGLVREVEGAIGELGRVKKGVEDGLARLEGLQVAVEKAVAGRRGESPAPPSTLTPETAPARTQRAVTWAEHLQRQVLVRGVALKDTGGEQLADREVLEKARQSLDLLDREGLTAPSGAAFETARVLQHGDVVFTVSNKETARWLQGPAVRSFANKMGTAARLVERHYKLIAEYVPVEFDPSNGANLRALEEAHGIRPESILQAAWVKQVDRRRPEQRFAFLSLTFDSAPQANIAIKGLTIAGRKVLVRREVVEPKRCLKCQSYGTHFAKECPQELDTCSTCAGAHPTSRCTVTDPVRYRCVNCKEEGHAAWDRCCPTFRRQVSVHSQRRADNGFRFFVTDDPETWVTDEEALALAPPSSTLWAQISRMLAPSTGSAPTGLRQTHIDRFLRQAVQPTPTPRA